MKGTYFYIRKSDLDLDTLNLPSCGPYGSVRGMRKHFWGFDCDVARQGAYSYKLPKNHDLLKYAR